MGRAFTVVLAAFLAACGSGDDTASPPAKQPPPTGCAPGEREVDGKGCLPAGTQDDGCAAGERATDAGSCQAAGIPADSCAPGFQADGTGGCVAVLPADICPSGTMAVPGDTQCRDIGPCGAAPWGDIPVGSATQYVDAAYVGGSSDGTSAKPWTSIQQAIAAASQGAIIAVAQGIYAGPIAIAGNPIRLWGRCAKLVEIVGAAGDKAAISVTHASGAEVHGVGVDGQTEGIYVSASTAVVIDRVWIHDVDDAGLYFSDLYGTTEVTVRDSLVERAANLGTQVLGSTLTLERSAIRQTRPVVMTQIGGEGIRVGIDTSTNRRSTGTLRSSVIEANLGAGVFVPASDATIEASVVRGTLPYEGGSGGCGILAQAEPAGSEHATVTVQSSVVADNRSFGIVAIDSDAKIATTVVRGTRADNDPSTGPGIAIVRKSSPAPVTGAIEACVVDDNQARGIYVDGASVGVTASIVRATKPDAKEHNTGLGIHCFTNATATIESTVVDGNVASGITVRGAQATVRGSRIANTLPHPTDQLAGQGIDIEDDPDSGQRSQVTIETSVFDGNSDGSIVVLGSDVGIDSTLVRNTRPSAWHDRGVGVAIQRTLMDTMQPATGTIRTSVITDSSLAGLMVIDADVTVDTTLVRNTTRATDGLYGDGIDVVQVMEASLALASSRVEQSARAGVAVFSAPASLRDVTLECNPIALDGENFTGAAAALQDLGSNTCSCGDAITACRVESDGLEPPPAL